MGSHTEDFAVAVIALVRIAVPPYRISVSVSERVSERERVREKVRESEIEMKSECV